MKQSRYNVFVDLDENKSILYNTLSRKYKVFQNSEKDRVKEIVKDLHKSQYEVEEAEIIKELIEKRIIIKDNFDELESIRYKECDGRFQDQVFYLKIQPTLDCNFRCVYCYEEHKDLKMDEQTSEKLIKLVQKISKRVKKLNVNWFGGEPTLEFDRIIELTGKFKEICERNDCYYSASMVSNGYLFTDEIINKLEGLSIKAIQITLDGPKEFHDKLRPLTNGNGTFDKVKSNILKILETNTKIIFRININEDNHEHIYKIFDMVPQDRRSGVRLTMSNLFQNKGKLNLFNIYKMAIEKGYRYNNISNGSFRSCEACCRNSFMVEPNGIISPCTIAGENGMHYGELSKDGDINFKNIEIFYKFHNISAFDSEMCKKCIQLPMCMGGCKYSRYENPNICNKNIPDGLSLEEKIKLHYYHDLKHNN